VRAGVPGKLSALTTVGVPPGVFSPSPPGGYRVKVTHPHAHFEQQVRDAAGRLVEERVIAETRNGQQVPVPTQIQYTRLRG
jgi:YD repeat-containing protein